MLRCFVVPRYFGVLPRTYRQQGRQLQRNFREQALAGKTSGTMHVSHKFGHGSRKPNRGRSRYDSSCSCELVEFRKGIGSVRRTQLLLRKLPALVFPSFRPAVILPDLIRAHPYLLICRIIQGLPPLRRRSRRAFGGERRGPRPSQRKGWRPVRDSMLRLRVSSFWRLFNALLFKRNAVRTVPVCRTPLITRAHSARGRR